MRTKRDFRTGSRENYRKFRKQYKHIKITFKEYKEVLYTYNRMLIAHILETGDQVRLKHGMGYLTVSKYKPSRTPKIVNGKEYSRLNVDWKATHEEGKTVYFLNPHTDGYSFFFMWRLKYARVNLANIWSMRLYREHKKSLGAILQDPNNRSHHLYKERYKKPTI